MSDNQVLGQDTQEFNMQTFRLVKTRHSVGMTSEVLGLPEVSLPNWGRSSEPG